MTLAEAAKTYARTDREIALLNQRRTAARTRLLDHLRTTRTGRYRNIQYSRTTRRSLDQTRVKQFLGDKLGRFLKESPVESLTVLD